MGGKTSRIDVVPLVSAETLESNFQKISSLCNSFIYRDSQVREVEDKLVSLFKNEIKHGISKLIITSTNFLLWYQSDTASHNLMGILFSNFGEDIFPLFQKQLRDLNISVVRKTHRECSGNEKGGHGCPDEICHVEITFLDWIREHKHVRIL